MKKVFIVIVAVMLLTVGCNQTNKQKEDPKKDQTFAEAYNINKDNSFEAVSLEKVLSVLDKGTGVIYFGFPTCPWCQKAVPVLEEVARDEKLETIYYFNPQDVRDQPTDLYDQLIDKLGNNLDKDENGESILYVPDVYFVKDGKIIGHNLGTVESHKNADDKLTEKQYNELKDIYTKYIKEIQ